MPNEGKGKTETWLKNKFVHMLKKAERGGTRIWWFKVAGGIFQKAGVPDFILCVEGRFCAAELKAPSLPPSKVVPSPAQAKVLKLIVGAGGDVIVSNNLDELINWVSGLVDAYGEHERGSEGEAWDEELDWRSVDSGWDDTDVSNRLEN